VREPLDCVSQPYWDSPRQAKSNVFVGLDPLLADDVLHAQMAMWAFWYRPLSDAEHGLLADENPSSIAGPLPLLMFPPIEAGRPMLDFTPREFLLQPQTSVRGVSTFTLCLNSDVAGAVMAPTCQSWTSGQPVGQLTYKIFNPLSNPNPSGDVRFWWTSSFVGTNLPGSTTEAYWLSLFVLPGEMLFARTIPFSQLTSTTQTWTMNFSSTPEPLPTLWKWMPGSNTTGGGYAYLNMQGEWAMRTRCCGPGAGPGRCYCTAPLSSRVIHFLFFSISSFVSQSHLSFLVACLLLSIFQLGLQQVQGSIASICFCPRTSWPSAPLRQPCRPPFSAAVANSASPGPCGST